MTSFESAQEAITKFKQVIAEKGMYSSHIPALVAKLSSLINACSVFLFNPEIIRDVNDYRIVLSQKELLKYADENIYSNVGLDWLNRNKFDMTIRCRNADKMVFSIQPNYLINTRVYVKSLELPVERLLEIYALSERNEEVSYQANMVNKTNPWQQHNPYIDDELIQMQDRFTQGVTYAGKNTHLPVGEEARNTPSDIKHLVFILVESIFHSIESTKIDKNSTGADLIVSELSCGRTLTNSAVVKAERKSDNSVILSILTIETEKFDVINSSFFRNPHYKGLGVEDWIYFRFCGRKLALSPSLGISRHINISEYYNLNSFTTN